jgi:YHS domain-containing protein
MIPLRLLILVVLVYFGWRLLRRFMLTKNTEPAVVDETHQESDPELEDVLVEDPVCHTLIPKNQALRFRKDNTTYYFCSEKCCDQFSGQPEKGEK